MTENLTEEVRQSMRWTAFSAVAGSLLQFAQMVVLARLLAPSDFGKMAVVLVFIRFCYPLMELGLSAAVIQNHQPTSRQLSTMYWVNVLLGMLFFVLLALMGSAIGAFYRQPDLAMSVAAAALSLLILPWGAQFQALLTKEMQFNRLSVIQLAGQVVELVLAVALAANGWGIWSLVWSYLVRTFLKTFLNVVLGWKIHRPQFIFNLREASPMLRFGAFEAGNLTANFASANVDKLIIGKLLGAEWLGLYTIAWELMAAPISRINPVVTQVTFPLFSKLQNDSDALNHWFIKTSRLLLFVNVPLYLGMALTARELLAVFYGERWTAAAACLSILAITGIARSLGNLSATLLLAKGRSAAGFYWNVFWGIAVAALLVSFLTFRPALEWAAWAQLAGVAGLYWIYFSMVAKASQLSFCPVVVWIFKLMLLCVPIAAGVWALDFVHFENNVIALAVKVGIGAGLFAAAFFLAKKLLDPHHPPKLS